MAHFERRSQLPSSGWSKAGPYPFNPERVLKDIHKPLTELYLSQSVDMAEPSQSVTLQTPVTSEALTSLRNRIERDINMLDNQSKCRLQKLAKAAEKAFAERALLLDENKLLFEQNNESRPRVSTRSTVIGKAKIISCEDIVEAQRKRDAKKLAYAFEIPSEKVLRWCR